MSSNWWLWGRGSEPLNWKILLIITVMIIIVLKCYGCKHSQQYIAMLLTRLYMWSYINARQFAKPVCVCACACDQAFRKQASIAASCPLTWWPTQLKDSFEGKGHWDGSFSTRCIPESIASHSFCLIYQRSVFSPVCEDTTAAVQVSSMDASV